MLETGKSLSTTKIKFCLWDLQLTYIILNRMRNIHAMRISMVANCIVHMYITAELKAYWISCLFP